MRKHFPVIAAHDPDGQLIPHLGRYAGGAVLTAFEMMGGVDRLADWGDKHPDDFFTKVFPKVITKEVEHGVSDGIETLLARLDAGETALNVTPNKSVDIPKAVPA